MKYYLLSFIVLSVILSSCANGEHSEYLAAADSTAFSGNIADINSSSRKISKEADITCSVANVFTATTRLEQLTQSLGGMVASSRFGNTTIQEKQYAYHDDSIKQVRAYTPTAELTLRIPSQYLDSVLNYLPNAVSFIEHRNLQQTDYTLAYLGNALKNKAVDTVTQTEEQLTAVDRRMENLSIVDKVNYATVTIALTQPEQIYTEVVVDTDKATAAPFTLQLHNAFMQGYTLLKALVLFIAYIWPLILLTAAIVFVYKRRTYFKRLNKA